MHHIGHFLNYLDRGGTPGMIISLMRRSVYSQVYVTFHASDERKKEFEELGLELVEVADVDEAVKFMKQNVKVVHASNSGGPEPGVEIGVRSELPVIETCQSPSLPSGSMYEQVHVVPVSNGILRYWPDDIRYDRVIYSCAERIPTMDKFEAKKTFGLDPNRKVVGRVGRLEGLKRPWDFVRTAVELHEADKELQYLLVGDGGDGDGVRGEVNLVKNTHNFDIVMPGYLTGVDKEIAYNAIDIFLYPTSSEGFGISFAEAMSLGLPIVTYSDPVNVDIVGAAGVYAIDNLFYNVPYPWDALAYLTLDVLANAREYEKLSKFGMSTYNRRYTPQRMTEEYDNLYAELLNDK